MCPVIGTFTLVRNIECTKNSKTADFWSQILVFRIEKFHFQFRKLQEFIIWKIQKNVNLENSKNLQVGKFQEFSIWEIQQTCNLENF